MKRLLFLLVVLTFFSSMFAADVIVLNDATEIECKIVEVGDGYIKYRRLNDANGPLFNLSTAKIFFVKYESGEKVNYNAKSTQSADDQSVNKNFVGNEGTIGNSIASLFIKDADSDTTAVQNIMKRFAFQAQVGGHINFLTGKGADGIDAGLGYNLGASCAFFLDKPFGFEVGTYMSQYGMSFGESDNDHHFKMTLRYIDLQLLGSIRYNFGTSAIEYNVGVGIDFGWQANVKYKSEHLYDAFDKKTLKDTNTSLLMGLTYRWEDGYLRLLGNIGLTNLHPQGEPVNLMSIGLGIGYVF